MHVIIVGGGKIGSTLAEELSAEKHDVIIIEIDQVKCEELSKTLSATILHGSGTDIELLEEAEIGKADIVAALTSKEEINLMVCLLAKNIKHCKTVARIKNPEYKKIFKRLGVDVILSPEVAAASFLEEVLTKPEVVDLAFITRGDAVVLEFAIKKDTKVIGREIKELEYPKGSLIIAIYEKNKLIIPNPKTKIKEGDKVLIITRKEIINKVRKLFS